MFGYKTIRINLAFTRSRKSKDVEIASLHAGSHLGAHARAAKSEFESEAILREESGDEARRK